MSSMGYCPTCKKNVYKKRDDFSFLLAFILAFTGIGLVIYILYYIDQTPKYCIICETECIPYQLENQSTNVKEIEYNNTELITDNKVKFCHSCGGELENRGAIKFCHLCGSNLE